LPGLRGRPAGIITFYRPIITLFTVFLSEEWIISYLLLTNGIIITIIDSNLVLDKTFKEMEKMKISYILRGILGLALLFAITAVGCDNGSGTPAKTYTVSFDGGDGSGTPPAAQTAEEGGSITLPGKGGLSAPAGKEFDGWKAGDTVYTAGDSYTVTADAFFIAQWKGVARTVTFDADGGTPATTSQPVNSGEAVGPLPADPTRTGYTFDDWYTEKNGGGTQFTATTIVNADITVYANWKADTPQVKVIFDADGGTPTSTEKTVSNGKVEALPADPTRTGYTFDGWYTETNGGGDKFTAEFPVTGDLKVYAKWKAEDPFIGGIWLGWGSNLNYKFAEVDGGKVYYTATDTTFSVGGTYEFNPVTHELTLRPRNGAATMKKYEIKNSLLIFEQGEAASKDYYTRNPETGGGFSGEPAPAPLGGIWQNDIDENDILGFNKDGEYFITATQKNRDGRYWWHVVGTYEYKGDELTLRYNGIDGKSGSDIYTVEFFTNNQILERTGREGKSTFKKDNTL
jgi:uncharacterized repeat protein (TIGR02543 family)